MKRSFPSWLFFTILVISLLACRSLAGASPTSAVLPTSVITLPPRNSSVVPDLTSLQDDLITLYERANPGVVAIQVLTQSGGGLGSGFVFDDQGHIVTNFHVVEGETDLEVDFASGFKVRGRVIGTDLDSDLAVIKVDAPADQLHPLSLGDSDLIRIGQVVVAIGNPFGLNGTMTVGFISGKGRIMESLREAPGGNYFSAAGLIQTDAAINPGNSGGPLLNLNGEVIGINRAIRTTNFTDTGQPTNTGIGFAISSNIVKRVVPGLIANGQFDYPYLGITSTEEISLLQQEALGLPRSDGAYVSAVTPGGPADKAALQPGDLILRVDGQPVRVFSDLLYYLISQKSPGDIVTLTVLRDNREKEVALTLEKRP